LASDKRSSPTPSPGPSRIVAAPAWVIRESAGAKVIFVWSNVKLEQVSGVAGLAAILGWSLVLLWFVFDADMTDDEVRAKIIGFLDGLLDVLIFWD
jgi:hypothetical protein